MKREGVRRLSLAVAAASGFVTYVYCIADTSSPGNNPILLLILFLIPSGIAAGLAWCVVRLIAWVAEGFSGSSPSG